MSLTATHPSMLSRFQCFRMIRYVSCSTKAEHKGDGSEAVVFPAIWLIKDSSSFCFSVTAGTVMLPIIPFHLALNTFSPCTRWCMAVLLKVRSNKIDASSQFMVYNKIAASVRIYISSLFRKSAELISEVIDWLTFWHKLFISLQDWTHQHFE